LKVLLRLGASPLCASAELWADARSAAFLSMLELSPSFASLRAASGQYQRRIYR
jgi:hypothetical protein